MINKFLICMCFFFCISSLANGQNVTKVTADFANKFKSEKVDDRVQAVQTLKGIEWHSSMPYLCKALEDPSLKVITATKEVVESYQGQKEVATWILSKGVNTIKNKFGRGYLIAALGKFHYDEVNDTLLKLLRVTSEPELIIPIMESVSELGYASSIPELIKCRRSALYGRHFGFRKTLFDALIKFPDKSVIEFFISTLAETEGLIAVETEEYLALVTGSRQMGAANWKKWWDENKDTLEVKKVSLEEINKKILEIKPAGEISAYYGISILAKRIVFIMDISGSMNFKNSTESRLEVAKRELTAAIRVMPEKANIEIVSFSGTASVWFGALKLLTKAGKTEVENRIKTIVAKGGTNTYDSFDKAFGVDDNVESIYFMSDGAPSLGPIFESEDLLDQIYTWNRFRKVQIHSIGLVFGVIPPEFVKGGMKEDIPKLKNFLSQLAIQNGGQFKIQEN